MIVELYRPSNHLLQNPGFPLSASIANDSPSPLTLLQLLQTSEAVLFVDVSVPLLLLSILKDHCNTENKNRIYTDNAKCCSEDQIEVFVGESREWSDATTLLRSNEGVGTSAILNKWRCGRVKVSAAVELGPCQRRLWHSTRPGS